MKRTPINVALDPELAQRIRVTAAKLGMRTSHLIERFVREGLPEQELQAKANENARTTKEPRE